MKNEIEGLRTLYGQEQLDACLSFCFEYAYQMADFYQIGYFKGEKERLAYIRLGTERMFEKELRCLMMATKAQRERRKCNYEDLIGKLTVQFPARHRITALIHKEFDTEMKLKSLKRLQS